MLSKLQIDLLKKLRGTSIIHTFQGSILVVGSILLNVRF